MFVEGGRRNGTPAWPGRVPISTRVSGLGGLSGNVLFGQSIIGFDPKADINCSPLGAPYIIATMRDPEPRRDVHAQSERMLRIGILMLFRC